MIKKITILNSIAKQKKTIIRNENERKQVEKERKNHCRNLDEMNFGIIFSLSLSLAQIRVKLKTKLKHKSNFEENQ